MKNFAHAAELSGSAPTAKAKSLLALSLVQMLFVIEKQLAVYRERSEELFARHPDHDLFGSLPGAGPKIAPRLLSEIGDNRERFDGDAQTLQCLGGTAPVTKRSGKDRHCHQRWACDKHLRHAISADAALQTAGVAAYGQSTGPGPVPAGASPKRKIPGGSRDRVTRFLR